MCRFGWNCSSIQTCTLDAHLHRVTYTRYRINTTDSPDDEHRGARNMYRIGINIYEKRILRQVIYKNSLKQFLSANICVANIVVYSYAHGQKGVSDCHIYDDKRDSVQGCYTV